MLRMYWKARPRFPRWSTKFGLVPRWFGGVGTARFWWHLPGGSESNLVTIHLLKLKSTFITFILTIGAMRFMELRGAMMAVFPKQACNRRKMYMEMDGKRQLCAGAAMSLDRYLSCGIPGPEPRLGLSPLGRWGGATRESCDFKLRLSFSRTKHTWDLSLNIEPRLARLRKLGPDKLWNLVLRCPNSQCSMRRSTTRSDGLSAESQTCSLWDLSGPLCLAEHFESQTSRCPFL